MKNKKKKVKVIYVDDGRTLYNMDGVKRQNVIVPEKISVARREKAKDNDKERARLEKKSVARQ